MDVLLQIPEIRTPRLLLRGWRPDDGAPFAAMNADPQVMEFMPAALSRQESDELIHRIQEHTRHFGFGLWALELVESAAFIGFAGLSRPSFDAPFTPCVEVGWRLATACWGKGYATEAAEAALDFGFNTVGLCELVSFTVPANLRSRRVMEKLGMQHDPADDFDHPKLPHGHALQRHVLYRIDRANWRRHEASRAVRPRQPA